MYQTGVPFWGRIPRGRGTAQEDSDKPLWWAGEGQPGARRYKKVQATVGCSGESCCPELGLRKEAEGNRNGGRRQRRSRAGRDEVEMRQQASGASQKASQQASSLRVSGYRISCPALSSPMITTVRVESLSITVGLLSEGGTPTRAIIPTPLAREQLPALSGPSRRVRQPSYIMALPFFPTHCSNTRTDSRSVCVLPVLCEQTANHPAPDNG